MAGTMEISDELCWMPASWVFNNVLDRTAAIVEHENPALAEMLQDGRCYQGSGYVDLRKSDHASFDLFVRAVDVALGQYQKEGPDSFYDPTFYPGFMDRLRELRDMLHQALGERRRTN